MPGPGGPTYLIGVDTGGTYTDAAVIEARGHRIIATAKALTTKGDLAVGVAEAITQALAKLAHAVPPQDVAMVSVSTTLATNAVVEGHGSATGVILIGFDAAMVERTGIARAFPEIPIAQIAGGHNHNGDPVCPLDTAALEAAVRSMAPKVEAFAVAGAFAVRNAGDTVHRTLLGPGRAAPGPHRRAQRAPDSTHLGPDRCGAARHGAAAVGLPADDRQGRRLAGPGRVGGDTAN
jgi:Hydantoinase/oxoprolinase N-terminal region